MLRIMSLLGRVPKAALQPVGSRLGRHAAITSWFWCKSTPRQQHASRFFTSLPFDHATSSLENVPSRAATPLATDTPGDIDPMDNIGFTTESRPFQFAEAVVHKIQDIETYESLVYQNCDDPEERTRSLPLLIFFFHSQRSTPAISMLQEFAALATKGGLSDSAAVSGRAIPKLFFSIDVDQVPRAAYHADVDDVPTIVLMRGDDAYRVKIAPEERSLYHSMMPRLCEVTLRQFIYKYRIDRIPLSQKLDEINRTPVSELNRLESRAAWYSHNIGIDNLNVQRVGWPTR